MEEVRQHHKINIKIWSEDTGGLIKYSYDLETVLIQALSGKIITPLLNLVIPNCSLELSLDDVKLDISEKDFARGVTIEKKDDLPWEEEDLDG